MKVDKTPLEMVSSQLKDWVDRTEDEIATYPLIAAIEIVHRAMAYEEEFASKIYDDGASSIYGYETGRKYFLDQFKKGGPINNK